MNRIVTHGFPYSGWRPEVEWPGLTTFEWTYSEMWGVRQPGWKYAREFGDWISRTQLILQTGIPRVDIGLYRHKYIDVDIKVRPLTVRRASCVLASSREVLTHWECHQAFLAGLILFRKSCAQCFLRSWVSFERLLSDLEADNVKHYGMGENIFGDPSLANNGYSYVSVSPSLLQLVSPKLHIAFSRAQKF